MVGQERLSHPTKPSETAGIVPLPEKAAVIVLVDDAECLGEGGHFGTGLVAVPFQVGSFPEDFPDVTASDELELGNGILAHLTRPAEGGPHIKELDRVTLEALAFPNAVPHGRIGSPAGPESVFDERHVRGDFVVGEGHGGEFTQKFAPGH